MDYLFAPPSPPSLPIQGSNARFPVRRIFCIGLNYADHVREMGSTIDRGKPVFFLKPADALVSDNGNVPYPPATSLFHHEVEMVLALHHGGHDIDPARAGNCIFGHGVGLDLTRRDLQAAAKEKGRPWDTAKGVDHGAPVSALCPVTQSVPGKDTTLSLEVNGERRQHTHLANMVWSANEIIAELSTLFELKAGDLIFTGTPSGVAPLAPGDQFRAELEGVAVLEGHID